MKASLRYLHCPDVHDLSTWVPDGDFAILVQLLVGPEGEEGEESFDITLCSLGWLADRVQEDDVVDGRHHLIVDTYDYNRIEEYLRERVSACEGLSWKEVGEKLGRLGYWEFEDYRE
jgi:hypothetical protein